jgi:hypothetical protein
VPKGGATLAHPVSVAANPRNRGGQESPVLELAEVSPLFLDHVMDGHSPAPHSGQPNFDPGLKPT